MYTFYLHFQNKTQTNPYQLLAPILRLCLLHLVRLLLGCHFLRSEWSGEYNGRWAINLGLLFLFGRRKRKIRTPDRMLMGDKLDVLHPLFILSYPVNVDNIHLIAYWESIHLVS